MPEHIVLSPYSFVGFEICNKLMEEGIEVIGVDLPVSEGPDPLEKEEKELYIGRNSNFTIKEFEQIISGIKNEEYTFYISDVNLNDKAWRRYFDEMPIRNNDRVVYVVTDQKCLINRHIQRRINTTIILPTVYGPWVPKNTMFCKCLNQTEFPFEQYEIEEKRDAIFISDAITAIFNVVSLEHGIYEVQSDIKGHWQLLLKELGYQIIVDDWNEESLRTCRSDIKKYVAETKISPQEGVEIVKRHLSLRDIMR